ncbi:MAG: type IX secretion system membrane protein PorP/SprF [Bacteroidales bacterium]|nr:type IX secretion system membrane protein PorP/SprF [Bacteroidales bacterium]
MKNILKYSLAFCLLFLAFHSSAQQLPLYSQYKNNGFLINPAMAGYDGYTSLNVTARKQWVGFTDAPFTYSASLQTRLMRKSYSIINRPAKSNRLSQSTRGRVGLGGFVFSDVNGLVSRTGVQMTYAYHIFMYKSQLSFGLAGQMFQYKIDQERISTYSELAQMGRDPLVESNLNFVAFIPDATFGVFWTSPEFYLGFSANQLFQSYLKLGSTALGNLKLYRHYYLMGGYRFINEGNGFDLEPSFLFKSTEQFLPQADLTLKLYYRTDYWIGSSYRTNGTLAAMFGVRADKVYIGYAYDYALSAIRKYNFGSHEIFVSLKFGDDARRYRWLNRY